MARHKNNSREYSGMTVLLIGVLCSLLLLALLSFIFSLIAYTMDDPTGMTRIFSLAALLLTAAISGFVLSKLKGEGGILISVLSSLLFCLILLLFGLIGTGGKLPIGIPINYICYMGVASLFAFFGRKKEKRRKFN